MIDFLVTGANGQVGSELCRILTQTEVPHVGLGRSELDVGDQRAVARAIERFGPRCVVNCAAYNAVDAAESDRAGATRVNAAGPEHLAEICAQREALLVHFSTDYVFDGSKTVPYVETDPPRPLSAYGQSKLDGEVAVLSSTATALVLRVSWVFGRIGRGFVDSVIAWAQKGAVRVVTDQCSVPCDATALAAFVVEAVGPVLDDPALGGLYHYSMGPPVTRFEYAKAILAEAAALGLVAPVELVPVTSDAFDSAATRPGYSVLSGERLAKAFGTRDGDWRDGLAAYLRDLV